MKPIQPQNHITVVCLPKESTCFRTARNHLLIETEDASPEDNAKDYEIDPKQVSSWSRGGVPPPLLFTMNLLCNICIDVSSLTLNEQLRRGAAGRIHWSRGAVGIFFVELWEFFPPFVMLQWPPFVTTIFFVDLWEFFPPFVRTKSITIYHL